MYKDISKIDAFVIFIPLLIIEILFLIILKNVECNSIDNTCNNYSYLYTYIIAFTIFFISYRYSGNKYSIFGHIHYLAFIILTSLIYFETITGDSDGIKETIYFSNLIIGLGIGYLCSKKLTYLLKKIPYIKLYKTYRNILRKMHCQCIFGKGKESRLVKLAILNIISMMTLLLLANYIYYIIELKAPMELSNVYIVAIVSCIISSTLDNLNKLNETLTCLLANKKKEDG